MLRETVLERARADGFTRAGAIVALLLLALYLVPGLPAETVAFIDEFVTVPALLVLLLAAIRFPRGADPPVERRFWTLVSAAFACWLLINLVFVAVPRFHELPGAGPVTDCINCLFYAFMILAAERRPDRGGSTGADDMIYRLSIAGIVLFVLGMAVYFVAIPAHLSAAAVGSLVPSYLLFIALDLCVGSRFLFLAHGAHAAGDPRWARIYAALGIALLLGMAIDVLELLNHVDAVTILRESPLSLLWYLPYFAAFAAARIRVLDRNAASSEAGHGEPPGAERALTSTAPLVAYAFAVPVVHFVVHTAGLAGPGGRHAREVLVLALLVALAGLAVIQQVLQRRRHRQLRADLERTTAELERSRRLVAIGRLAAGVAHDFNNVLTSIRGSTELLRKCAVGQPGAVELCDTIERTTGHAGELTRQLLACGQRQPLRPAVLDLNRLVVESREILAGILGESIALEIETQARRPVVRFDPAQVRQVLLNLAINARDAMPDGGTLSVTTRDRAAAERPAGADDFVVLEVRDSGTGMGPETIEHIFEPFFTTKGPGRGSGLGLATVYGVVEQSGGRIRVESALGAGTTFSILVPRAEETGDDEAAASGVPTILVVDDDREVRSLVAAFLRTADYHVLTAGDGEEALAMSSSHVGRIDLVLTDVTMPAIGGPELARSLARQRPETRVIFMSGYAGARDLADPVGGGPRLLRKPFGLAEALDAVREALPERFPG